MIDDVKATNEIAPAFLKAQSKLKGVVKNNDGLFNAKYADLGQIIATCQKPLNDEGIIITQGHDYDVDNNIFFTTTTLLHKSGQSITNRIGFPVVKKDPHGVAGLATYGRRYSLFAMLGIAAVDDDGTDAMGGYVTDDHKKQFNELLKHKAFEGTKTPIKNKWAKIKTAHDAETALIKLAKKAEDYDQANAVHDDLDSQMKSKMEMDA